MSNFTEMRDRITDALKSADSPTDVILLKVASWSPPWSLLAVVAWSAAMMVIGYVGHRGF